MRRFDPPSLRFSFQIALLVLTGTLAACSSPEPAPDSSAESAETPSRTSVEPQAAEADSQSDPQADTASDPTVVVFLGDSLTAGFGLDEEQAFPELVGEALEADGLDVKVVNAGISGDTTAGGLARLDWLLRQEPDVLVVGLGGNDGLRGLDLEASESNLRQIVSRAREAGVEVLLLGMLIPPNYGPDYTEDFAAMYPRLAAELDVALVPFLLEGVAGDPALNLPDGIHPNAEGQVIVAETVTEALREVLER